MEQPAGNSQIAYIKLLYSELIIKMNDGLGKALLFIIEFIIGAYLLSFFFKGIINDIRASMTDDINEKMNIILYGNL